MTFLDYNFSNGGRMKILTVLSGIAALFISLNTLAEGGDLKDLLTEEQHAAIRHHQVIELPVKKIFSTTTYRNEAAIRLPFHRRVAAEKNKYSFELTADNCSLSMVEKFKDKDKVPPALVIDPKAKWTVKDFTMIGGSRSKVQIKYGVSRGLDSEGEAILVCERHSTNFQTYSMDDFANDIKAMGLPPVEFKSSVAETQDSKKKSKGKTEVPEKHVEATNPNRGAASVPEDSK
jgi:hypothetical protein